MHLQDQVVIITGGASGLGEATARHLATQGCRIVIADMNQEGGERLVAELGTDKAAFVKADITQEADAQAAVDTAVERFGGLQLLVNCAGVAPAEKVVGREGPHRLDRFSRTIAINLIGTFNMIRVAAAQMIQQAPQADGERGVIINTASVAAFDGQVGQAAYAASKGGVVAMTLPIARELARHGIRINTIAPGIMQTPMMAAMPEDVQASLGAQVPFPSRMGKPAEFASLVAHIIDNAYLNGEVIRLDGAIRMGAK